MYRTRFKEWMPALTARLFRLYGTRWDFHELLSDLVLMLDDASADRDPVLTARDSASEKEPDWFLKETGVGMMLYVDLFAGDFAGLETRIPELKELGINYVHLMPLFRAPEAHNDGGYAVSSYRQTESRLGSMKDLQRLGRKFHEAGIALVLDFVFNHTSDEHDWALAAKRGEAEFRDYYFIYPDKAEADEWNRSLREIFPDTRRGSFTYVEAAGGWVWTTFNSFQWDLNYANPRVFLAMCREMLFLANLGVDVLRLDALAFVWKQKGTNCENLELAHVLIQAFQFVARIAAPTMIFKSEAIVHPDEVIRYIGQDECRLSYNPLQMALFWEATAARSARLLQHSLSRRWSIPAGAGWVNYVRCHDDIGWTFSDEDARELGIDGYAHRQFLNRFYTGRFEGSFARGEAFQLNPETGDCRVCGTMASLCGLEEAAELHAAGDERAELYGDMAVARMLMLYAVLFSLPGLPLLYAGDESALLNDVAWKIDPVKRLDSRWVHRKVQASSRKKTFLDSSENGADSWLFERRRRVFDGLRSIIRARKAEPGLGKTGIRFIDAGDEAVFAFSRDGERITVFANFSDRTAWCRRAIERPAVDLLTGEPFGGAPGSSAVNVSKADSASVGGAGNGIALGPYRVLWLKERE